MGKSGPPYLELEVQTVFKKTSALLFSFPGMPRTLDPLSRELWVGIWAHTYINTHSRRIKIPSAAQSQR